MSTTPRFIVFLNLLAVIILTALSAPYARADGLLVSSFGTNSILRYDSLTGAFTGTFATGGGLVGPNYFIFGPDGDLYVTSYSTNEVKRYDGLTGAFIDTFISAGSGGLLAPQDLMFMPNGNLCVVAGDPGVLCYDGVTGTFLRTLIPESLVVSPEAMAFGPDGNLYVGDFERNDIRRFNLETGELIGVFVSSGSGGLNGPVEFTFRSDGNLYVASAFTDEVLRYNGTTGAFIDIFASGGGLDNPAGISFGLDGNLLVTSFNSNSVLRYDGTTGAFIDVFIPAGSGGLTQPTFIAPEIPEPTTLILLGTGLAGVAVKMRKKLKNRKSGQES